MKGICRVHLLLGPGIMLAMSSSRARLAAGSTGVRLEKNVACHWHRVSLYTWSKLEITSKAEVATLAAAWYHRCTGKSCEFESHTCRWLQLSLWFCCNRSPSRIDAAWSCQTCASIQPFLEPKEGEQQNFGIKHQTLNLEWTGKSLAPAHSCARPRVGARNIVATPVY